jgi:hypothetical protein
MRTCKVQINIVAMLSLAKQRHQAKVFELDEELQVPTCSPCFTIQPTLSAIKNIGKFHLYRLSGLAIALITGFYHPFNQQHKLHFFYCIVFNFLF